MGYSVDSVRYLHIAYALFLGVQVLYVVWLLARWNRVRSDAQIFGTGQDRKDVRNR